MTRRGRRTRGRRASAVALLVTSLGMVGSCFRAEIDLTPLLQPTAGLGGMGGAGAGPVVGGGAGEPANGGGGQRSSDGGGGASGAGGESSGLPACVEGTSFTSREEACLLIGTPPSRAECAEQPLDGWRGCYDGGCTVCTEAGEVPGYPHYFTWHPCCRPNDTCSNHDPMVCNALCPRPTERDRLPPCAVLDPNSG